MLYLYLCSSLGDNNFCDFLYRSSWSSPDIPEKVFFELVKFHTSSVEFRFDNITYRQIDGVTMDSPLGPTLTNIFLGFHVLFFVVHLALKYIGDMWTILFNDERSER